MATVRFGVLTPSAMRVGTNVVTAAYLGTVRFWPLTSVAATGVLTGVGKRATAVMSGGIPGAVGSVAGAGRSATASVNGTFTGLTFAKYRTFNNPTDKIEWTLGNLSGTGSVPQTVVAVVRLLNDTTDGEVMAAPNYDPVDLYLNHSPPKRIEFIPDTVTPVSGPAWDLTSGWCLFAFRSVTGSPAVWSKSQYSGTAWPTPTHTPSTTTLTARTWPTSGTIAQGNSFDGGGPLTGDVVCIARFNRALSDAEVNALTGGVGVIQSTSGCTNLWMLGQATPADLTGTTTISTLIGTTLSSTDSPFLDGSSGASPPVTATLSGVGRNATATINTTFTAAPANTAVLTGVGRSAVATMLGGYTASGAVGGAIAATAKNATAVVNGTHVFLFTGTVGGIGRSATAAINANAVATVTGTVGGLSRSATASLNGAYSTPTAFARYRTFNGSTDQIVWSMGNLSGVGSCPQTIVAVVRNVSKTGDAQMFNTSSFNPLDLFYIDGGNKIGFYDGTSNVAGPPFAAGTGWTMIVFRSVVGSSAVWSRSLYTGTQWPTPTHYTPGASGTDSVTLLNWPWKSTDTIAMGDPQGMVFDAASFARFNTTLSDAQVNNLTTGVSAIAGTSGITNLWLLGQTSPVDLVGTSGLVTLTGTTLSTGTSPFPS